MVKQKTTGDSGGTGGGNPTGAQEDAIMKYRAAGRPDVFRLAAALGQDFAAAVPAQTC